MTSENAHNRSDVVLRCLLFIQANPRMDFLNLVGSDYQVQNYAVNTKKVGIIVIVLV